MSSRNPTLTLRQIVEFADEVAVLVATRVRKPRDAINVLGSEDAGR